MKNERIPLIDGDEFDALTKAKRIHIWRAGDRRKVKKQYNKRVRRQMKLARIASEDAQTK